MAVSGIDSTMLLAVNGEIMKTILFTMVGAIATSVSLAAVAGPDFYVIEKARASKQAEAHKSVSQPKVWHIA